MKDFHFNSIKLRLSNDSIHFRAMPVKDLPRFIVRDAALDKQCDLSDDEYRHSRVLRLESGEKVHAIDGFGNLYLANIELKKRSAAVNILSIEHTEKKPAAGIILGVAPTKNISRFEWVIEKTTELGVLKLIPLICENSERNKLNQTRLTKIIENAAKQSKRLWFPVLCEPTMFNDAIKEATGKKWIAHCIESKKVRASNFESEINTVFIGPEGDFSELEIKMAAENDFCALSLGINRLRTETAAVSVCAAYHLLEP